MLKTIINILNLGTSISLHRKYLPIVKEYLTDKQNLFITRTLSNELGVTTQKVNSAKADIVVSSDSETFTCSGQLIRVCSQEDSYPHLLHIEDENKIYLQDELVNLSDIGIINYISVSSGQPFEKVKSTLFPNSFSSDIKNTLLRFDSNLEVVPVTDYKELCTILSSKDFQDMNIVSLDKGLFNKLREHRHLSLLPEFSYRNNIVGKEVTHPTIVILDRKVKSLPKDLKGTIKLVHLTRE